MPDSRENQVKDPATQSTLSRSKPVFIVFLLVVAYFLITEHRAHAVAFLPYALLLLCPLMHLFMHGRNGHHHGGHRHHDGKQGSDAA
jgi:hypothetical protein